MQNKNTDVKPAQTKRIVLLALLSKILTLCVLILLIVLPLLKQEYVITVSYYLTLANFLALYTIVSNLRK